MRVRKSGMSRCENSHVCFCVSVCENCPRILRKDFESSVCAEYEVAGIVRDLLSLICSADVIPGRFEVRRFITENSPDHLPRLQRFSDSKFRSLLAEKFPDTEYGARHDFSQLSLVAIAAVERVIDRLCSPFVERRRRGVSFSCLCPELVINGDLDELATDLVGVSCFYQVSSHFGNPELYQAHNQYRAMVKGARERERKDS